MKNVFALVGAATITFVGLGWYLGWYKLIRQPGTPGTQRFQVDVNPNKFTNDMKKGAQRVEEIYDRLTDENNKPDQPAPASGPASQFFTPSSAHGNGSTN
jgi:hypothetical protein